MQSKSITLLLPWPSNALVSGNGTRPLSSGPVLRVKQKREESGREMAGWQKITSIPGHLQSYEGVFTGEKTLYLHWVIRAFGNR